MDSLKASVLSRHDLELIETNGYQTRTVNIKSLLFFRYSVGTSESLLVVIFEKPHKNLVCQNL
jgi:hypothetical protein